MPASLWAKARSEPEGGSANAAASVKVAGKATGIEARMAVSTSWIRLPVGSPRACA